MHIQTRKQLEQHEGTVAYLVHAFPYDCAWIEAYELGSVYETNDYSDRVVQWVHCKRVYIQRGVARLKNSVNPNSYWAKANELGIFQEISDDIKYAAEYFSLSDAGITLTPYNEHKVFTTLSEAKLYCELRLGLRIEVETTKVEAESRKLSVSWSPHDAEDTHEWSGGLAAIQDGGRNGMRTDPIVVIKEEQELVAPPEEVDASISNLLIAA